MEKMWTLQPTMNPIKADFIMNPKPPTMYAILNSIANYDKEEQTKIRDLARACHDKIFDFEYQLSDALNKDEFEIDILNHFMMRRIGFDTVTAFQLYLETKLHEILPYYNLMFDSFKDYNLFNNGETISRVQTDNRNSSKESVSDTTSVNQNRYSKYPENELDDIMSGTYVTDQNYTDTNNKSNINSNSNDNNITNETINRSPSDKMAIYKKYLETKRSVMTMIYKELDSLFYQLVD